MIQKSDPTSVVPNEFQCDFHKVEWWDKNNRRCTSWITNSEIADVISRRQGSWDSAIARNQKRCEVHGNLNDAWVRCPDCIIDMVEKEYNERRKTFFGLTASSWFMFLYIAVVFTAMAWIITAHVVIS